MRLDAAATQASVLQVLIQKNVVVSVSGHADGLKSKDDSGCLSSVWMPQPCDRGC